MARTSSDGRRRMHSALVLAVSLVLAACGATGPFPGEQPQTASEADPEDPTTSTAAPERSAEGADRGGGSSRAEAELAPEGPQANQPGRAQVSAAAERRAERNEAVVTSAGLEIPAIEVASPLVSLGLNPDRSMEVPDDFSVAGWYRHSPRPGDSGPAVIAGHVSSRSGPAVFHRLIELSPGDEVRVNYDDGRTVLFHVDRVEQYPKNQFPHDAVYGDTDGPELRLITCGGEFDPAAGSHRDNIVAYASLADEA